MLAPVRMGALVEFPLGEKLARIFRQKLAANLNQRVLSLLRLPSSIQFGFIDLAQAGKTILRCVAVPVDAGRLGPRRMRHSNSGDGGTVAR